MSKKLSLTLIGLLLTALFVVNGCRKNNAPPGEKEQPKEIPLKSMMDYYNTNIHPQNVDPLITANSRVSIQSSLDTSSFIGYPDWNRRYDIPFPGGEGMAKVPLTNYYVAFGYRDLLFETTSDAQIHGFVLEVRPDSAYLMDKLASKGVPNQDNRYYVDSYDFTGVLLFFNTSNRFIKGRRIENGVVIWELEPTSASSFAFTTNGWEGNNTEGYTLPEFVKTAPVPNPPTFYNWMPRSLSFPPINPPTAPFAIGGSGGPGGYSTPSLPGPKICKSSFVFSTLGPNTSQAKVWGIPAAYIVNGVPTGPITFGVDIYATVDVVNWSTVNVMSSMLQYPDLWFDEDIRKVQINGVTHYQFSAYALKTIYANAVDYGSLHAPEQLLTAPGGQAQYKLIFQQKMQEWMSKYNPGGTVQLLNSDPGGAQFAVLTFTNDC